MKVIGRGTQVVRERSAKPLYVGSIPTRASTLHSYSAKPYFFFAGKYFFSMEATTT